MIFQIIQILPTDPEDDSQTTYFQKILDLPAPLAETLESQCIWIRHQQTSVTFLTLYMMQNDTCRPSGSWGGIVLLGSISLNTHWFRTGWYKCY